MTHRIPIKLHLTGKSRLIFKFYFVIGLSRYWVTWDRAREPEHSVRALTFEQTVVWLNYPLKTLQKWIRTTLLRFKRMYCWVKNLMYFLEGLLIPTTLYLLFSSHWIRTWPKWANRSGHWNTKGKLRPHNGRTCQTKTKVPVNGRWLWLRRIRCR